MSKQQLYINGIAVDMPTDEIKIKVASNILADISKVMTAHSYSVTLPRTITNDNALGLAYVVAADTAGKTTHRYLTASLYVDGVPLFDGGRAVVNTVDEKGYNIGLFWGLLDVFEEIKRENLHLCDLPLSEHWSEQWGEWYQLQADNGVNYESGMNLATFLLLDVDSQEVAHYHPWHSPHTTAFAILDKVAQVYGVEFTFDATVRERLVRLTHPLTSLNIKCKDEVVPVEIAAVDLQVSTDNKRNLNWSESFTAPAPEIVKNCIYPKFTPTILGHEEWYHTVDKVSFGKFRVHGTCNREWAISFNEQWVAAAVVHIGSSPNECDDEDAWKVDAILVNGVWTLDVDFHGISHEGSLVRLRMPNGYWQSGETPEHDIKWEFEITDTEDARCGAYVPRGTSWADYAKYSHVRNYPNVSIMDYFKEIMAHTGACIVGTMTKPDSIHFAAIDEILAKTPQPLEMLGLTSIGMTLTDIAQRNIYTHAENDDDNLSYLADGVIYCNDETLEAERSAFDSKFKVPRLNYFKQYEIEPITDEDESSGGGGVTPPKYKCKWVRAGDYVCGWTPSTDPNNPNIGNLINTGQDFASIIRECYANYSALIARPKVAEVQTRLGILDLLNFDLSRPVYIDQLASSFIVTEIATEKGDTFKIKLVKI